MVIVPRPEPHFHREIELPFVSDVHNHRRRPAVSGQEVSNFLDWFLGRGKSDAHRGTIRQSLQPLQRERQVRATLVVRYSVDFVHNNGFDIAQNGATLFRSQQNVERLRCCDQNVWRPLQHGAALMHQRVAGADRGANLRHQQAAFARHLKNFAQWDFEVLLNIVAQRLQRRDIQNFSSIVEIAGQRLTHQLINTRKKRSQSFARARRRRNEGGSSGQNMRPALHLRLGRRIELSDKPLRDQRVRPGERGGMGEHRQYSNT